MAPSPPPSWVPPSGGGEVPESGLAPVSVVAPVSTPASELVTSAVASARPPSALPVPAVKAEPPQATADSTMRQAKAARRVAWVMARSTRNPSTDARAHGVCDRARGWTSAWFRGPGGMWVVAFLIIF